MHLNFGIQHQDPDDGEQSAAQTYFTQWGPGAPGFNQAYHLDQSLGRSSTMMPAYTKVVPRANYSNLSHLVLPHNRHMAYSESQQESI